MISAVLDDQGNVLQDDAPAALFPWWSFTKPVIATLVLRSVEAGSLELDTLHDNHPFSLLQLLQHRAGLRDYGPLASYKQAVAAKEPPWPAERLLKEVDYTKLAYAPGTGWLYSNVGYLLLRQALERVHDAPLAEIIQNEVCRPLGVEAKLAMSRQDFEELHWTPNEGYHPGWVYHGCLMGTALEAAKILNALLSGELLSDTALRMMLTQQMRDGPIPGRVWSEIGYGLGIMVGSVGEAGRIIGHTGCGPFCANLVAQFADHPQKLTVATFTEGGDETPAEFGAVTVAQRHMVNSA